MEGSKKLYVMISKTDTGVGSIIRRISGYPYNHVSLTMDESFRTWFSFARYNKSTPLWAGFLTEPVERFLSKGSQVDVQIFALPLIPERQQRLEQLFDSASDPECPLIYNHLELVTLIFGIRLPIPDAYTCVGFAGRVLGKPYRNIQDLAADLMPWLHYEGPLAALAPDSGDRSDPYFRDLKLPEILSVSAAHLGRLLGRLFQSAGTDTVASYLNERSSVS